MKIFTLILCVFQLTAAQTPQQKIEDGLQKLAASDNVLKAFAATLSNLNGVWDQFVYYYYVDFYYEYYYSFCVPVYYGIFAAPVEAWSYYTDAWYYFYYFYVAAYNFINGLNFIGVSRATMVSYMSSIAFTKMHNTLLFHAKQAIPAITIAPINNVTIDLFVSPLLTRDVLGYFRATYNYYVENFLDKLNATRTKNLEILKNHNVRLYSSFVSLLTKYADKIRDRLTLTFFPDLIPPQYSNVVSDIEAIQTIVNNIQTSSMTPPFNQEQIIHDVVVSIIEGVMLALEMFVQVAEGRGTRNLV